MINRALTSTFDLPQEQYVRGQGTGRQGGSASGGLAPDKMNEYFGIEPMATGLQYTGEIAKQAEKYYQEREKLKQFARTNWLNGKIDVTAPDPSNPAAVRAAQIYQMGLANLNFQGDKLKQSQEMFKPALKLQQENQYQFGEDVGNVAFAEQTPEQMGYATTLSPTMKAAAEAVNKDFSNYGQFQQAQGIAGNVQSMANQAAVGGGPRQQLEQQQAQVIFNPDYNPPAPRSNTGGTGSPISGLASEWAQLSVGKHPTFRLTEKLGKDGSYKSESTNNSFINKQYGQYLDSNGVPRPFIISRLELDNDTGEVTAFTAEGIAKPLPKDNIDVSMRQVIDKSQINEYEKYLQDLDSQGLLPKVKGQGGGVTTVLKPDIFVPASDEQVAAQTRTQAQSVKPQVQEIRQKISSDLDILDSSGWTKFTNAFKDAIPILGNSVPTKLQYASPYGKIEVEKSGDTYKILVDGKVHQITDPNNSKKTIKTFNKQFVDSFLKGYEVENLILKDKNGKVIAQPTQTEQSAAFDPTKF